MKKGAEWDGDVGVVLLDLQHTSTSKHYDKMWWQRKHVVNNAYFLTLFLSRIHTRTAQSGTSFRYVDLGEIHFRAKMEKRIVYD